MAKKQKLIGCFNKSADQVDRINSVWSDTNLDSAYTSQDRFARLRCRNCNNIKFEILETASYETSARCIQCGMYYIIHTG